MHGGTMRAMVTAALLAAAAIVGPLGIVAPSAKAAEFQANQFVTSHQSLAAVARLTDGGFVVAWQSLGQNGDLEEVYARRYDAAGLPVGNEFHVSVTEARGRQLPAVAGLANGGFVIVWQAFDGFTHNDIYLQRYKATGEPVGGEVMVNTFNGTDTQFDAGQTDPAVATLANGDFVVVWTSALQDGSGDGIFGQRFRVNGRKVGREFLINKVTANHQSRPAIAALSGATEEEGFVVVWDSRDQDGSGLGVYGRIFSLSGAKVGSPFRINKVFADDQFAPRVAALADGNFVVVWTNTTADVTVQDVHAQRFTAAGVKIGREFRVNQTTVNNQARPDVAALANGDFVVVWHDDAQTDGDDNGVFGRRYAADGTKIGKQFQINETTFSNQQNPAVAPFGADGFVVVWESDAQDGSGLGVFGKLFDP